MSRINWLGKYMVNEQAFETDVDIQRRVDQNHFMSGGVRDGFVTSLLVADKWGGREGLSNFLETNWSDKLGDTFEALYEHYVDRSDDNWKLRMPKDYEELERVARLFRETYVAYLIWWCMKNVNDGLSSTVWHDLAVYAEEAYWLPDKYEFWDVSEKDAPDEFLAKLWDAFFDRVSGRSRKFNFSNFVAANSVLTMLEERYYQKKAAAENQEYHDTLEENVKKEKEQYQKTVKEVEDYLNGKD